MAAWSNDALSDERDDSRLLMPAGMFFMVIGGSVALAVDVLKRLGRTTTVISFPIMVMILNISSK